MVGTPPIGASTETAARGKRQGLTSGQCRFRWIQQKVRASENLPVSWIWSLGCQNHLVLAKYSCPQCQECQNCSSD